MNLIEMLQWSQDKTRPLIAGLDCTLTPLFDLMIRLYVAEAFFKSGLTKIQDWSVTLALFEHEYRVPFLPVPLAAAMGTAGELILPILLALGLAGRFGAAGLLVVNAMAVISYPRFIRSWIAAPYFVGRHALGDPAAWPRSLVGGCLAGAPF